jgi:hypothetical protein
MIGDEHFYFIMKWLGLNAYNKIVEFILIFFYKYFAGFSKSTKKEEICFTQQRVAFLDWKAFSDQIKNIEFPIFLTFSTDDHLIQRERFEELKNTIVSAKKVEPHILVFSDGGHNIQKTKADEICHDIKLWLKKFNDQPIVSLSHDSDKTVENDPKMKIINHNSITSTASSTSKDKMKSSTVNEGDKVFIEDIDLQDELVTIRNPSSSTQDLSGWKISDDHGRNKFVIPEGTKVDPKGMLHIYCCAKGHKGAAAASVTGNAGDTIASSLKKPYIFWTNKDGTPRMKNVLNDGRLVHVLYISK